MMIPMLRRFGLMSLCVVAVFGCAKNADKPGLAASSSSDTGTSLFSQDPSVAPYYGDTILNCQVSPDVAPVNHLGSGTYISWPKGLAIDAQTGVIHSAYSEKGARYNVGFIKQGSKDTVFSQVILSGITYPDGVYLMGSDDSVIHPISVSVQGNAVFSGGHKAVDASGSISLTQTSIREWFGKDAKDGDVKTISVAYQIGQATAHTSLQLYYYTALSHVPSSLVNNSLAGLRSIPGITGDAVSHTTVAEQTLTTMGVTGNIVSTSTSSNEVTLAPKATNTATSTSKPAATAPAPTSPRPPQLVIVNVGHH